MLSLAHTECLLWGKCRLTGIYLLLIGLNYYLHWRSSSTTSWHLDRVLKLSSGGTATCRDNSRDIKVPGQIRLGTFPTCQGLSVLPPGSLAPGEADPPWRSPLLLQVETNSLIFFHCISCHELEWFPKERWCSYPAKKVSEHSLIDLSPSSVLTNHRENKKSWNLGTPEVFTLPQPRL